MSPFTWNNLKLPSVFLKDLLEKDSLSKKSSNLNKLSNTIDFIEIDSKIQVKKDKKIKDRLNPVGTENNRLKALSNYDDLHE